MKIVWPEKKVNIVLACEKNENSVRQWTVSEWESESSLACEKSENSLTCEKSEISLACEI